MLRSRTKGKCTVDASQEGSVICPHDKPNHRALVGPSPRVLSVVVCATTICARRGPPPRKDLIQPNMDPGALQLLLSFSPYYCYSYCRIAMKTGALPTADDAGFPTSFIHPHIQPPLHTHCSLPLLLYHPTI